MKNLKWDENYEYYLYDDYYNLVLEFYNAYRFIVVTPVVRTDANSNVYEINSFRFVSDGIIIYDLNIGLA